MTSIRPLPFTMIVIALGVGMPIGPSMTKDCPECLSRIPAAATRCAFCTVEQT